MNHEPPPPPPPPHQQVQHQQQQQHDNMKPRAPSYQPLAHTCLSLNHSNRPPEDAFFCGTYPQTECFSISCSQSVITLAPPIRSAPSRPYTPTSTNILHASVLAHSQGSLRVARGQVALAIAEEKRRLAGDRPTGQRGGLGVRLFCTGIQWNHTPPGVRPTGGDPWRVLGHLAVGLDSTSQHIRTDL